MCQIFSDEPYEWYLANYSKAYATRWYETLHEAIESLQDHPLRCARSREDRLFDFEVRELIIGQRRKNRRALFRIDGNSVAILHAGRRDTPESAQN